MRKLLNKMLYISEKKCIKSKPIQTLALCLSLLSANAAQATVLTFDEFSNGTELTTQYQSFGVTSSGVNIYASFSTPWFNQSAPNIAVALDGLMTFSLDSNITGDIQSVSAYFAGQQGAGIYAYDAMDNLLGQSLLPSNNNSMSLLSVASLSNAITKVVISGGAASYAIDNLSFTTESTSAVPIPSSNALLIASLGLAGFILRLRKDQRA